MLQTVRNSELKRRSYSHCKQITPKCCEISLLLREFRSLFVQCYGIPLEATRYMPQARMLRTSRWKPISQPCEFNLLLRKYFAALLSVCEISQTPFSPAKWFLKLPDTFAPTLLDLFFRYFWYNFHFLLVFNHSCNSLARKYPRKGKLPSYINSLVNTLRGRSEDICNLIYRIREQSTCSVFHIYSCLLFHFHFLANQTLRIFPQRMRG